MDLSNLKGPKKQKRKRVGRGEASGLGKTSGKGHKGQKARSGGGVSPGFEGGQMPLQRRLPKKGFTNIFKIHYNIVNLKDLVQFESGAVITPDSLREKGIVKRSGPIKLLSQGDVSAAFTIMLDRTSTAARKKIEAAGGKVEIA
ncbi:50S ribosomal protein L15 [Desulfomonile tiedjei]|uniref:Large ribosomal subunit protein uL15 n=1 Tax=Desulfomonile tiedjei (strain ATCC 49306 / DSM 6799 / DCB-1) TaxID=706587 RepID=I4CE80_DESTA|nr:50S ribosomal protein L15 [Desulfomonile tiedjei]AFM27871.1 LSU ribosomal protein L15P [Desulfomonile tiedjei DSM 6799]